VNFNEASGTSDMDGKAARVAETEAGAKGIKIASRAHGVSIFANSLRRDKPA